MSQPEPLTEQQLDEIAARTNAATPGPWKRKTELASHIVYVDNEDGTFSVLWNAEWATEVDAEFTAHAPDDVRVLLDEVRRQRAELAELRAKNAKLIRWHREDEAALAGMRGTIEYQRAEQAARTAPAPTTAPLAASQPSKAPGEGETAARAAAGRVEDSGPEVARIALTRSDLAALLAHQADVLAARWRAVAPGAGAWEVAAALSLTSHANDLTAEVKRPAVTELLDNIWAFSLEQQPAEDFTGIQPCGHDDYHDQHPWHDRPNVWCPGHNYDEAPTA